MLVYTDGLSDGDLVVWDAETERFRAADFGGTIPPGGLPGGGGGGDVPAGTITALQEAVVALQEADETHSDAIDALEAAVLAGGFATAILKTTANWTSTNPVVALGTLAIEQKTGGDMGVRIGNGTNTWSALDELGTGSGPVTSVDFVGGGLVTQLTATTDMVGGASITNFT
jgi:hypothetical protein